MEKENLCVNRNSRKEVIEPGKEYAHVKVEERSSLYLDVTAVHGRNVGSTPVSGSGSVVTIERNSAVYINANIEGTISVGRNSVVVTGESCSAYVRLSEGAVLISDRLDPSNYETQGSSNAIELGEEEDVEDQRFADIESTNDVRPNYLVSWKGT